MRPFLIHSVPASDTGSLFVVNGPSGVGKSSIIKAVMEDFTPDLVYSTSVTTRPKAAGEEDGVDFQFVDKTTFHKMLTRNEFLEWAQTHGGHSYGTPRTSVSEVLATGKSVVMDINTAGLRQVRAHHVGVIVAIMLVPPTMDELRLRLAHRGRDTADSIAERMATAQFELQTADAYDYVVMNDEFDAARDALRAIIIASAYMHGRQSSRLVALRNS